MVAYEPRVRRRGYFLHSADTGEPDTGDHENAEGINVRLRTSRSDAQRQFSSVRRSPRHTTEHQSQPEIRSGSVTGSRQRSHLPR